jgi:phosphoketolase
VHHQGRITHSFLLAGIPIHQFGVEEYLPRYIDALIHIKTYLEESYMERPPAIERNANGIRQLFCQFSWECGIPSHVAPETPGSIHEGGELGYSLAHAYGTALDKPDLIVACVVGDREAETGRWRPVGMPTNS